MNEELPERIEADEHRKCQNANQQTSPYQPFDVGHEETQEGLERLASAVDPIDGWATPEPTWHHDGEYLLQTVVSGWGGVGIAYYPEYRALVLVELRFNNEDSPGDLLIYDSMKRAVDRALDFVEAESSPQD